MTRDRDRTLSLEERTAIAEAARGDLFVSLHANAAPRRSLQGDRDLLPRRQPRAPQPARGGARERRPAQRSSTRCSARSRRCGCRRCRRTRAGSPTLVQREIVRGHAAALSGRCADLGVKKGPFYVLFLSTCRRCWSRRASSRNRDRGARLRDADYAEARGRADRARASSATAAVGARSRGAPQPMSRRAASPWTRVGSPTRRRARAPEAEVARCAPCAATSRAAREYLGELHRVGASGGARVERAARGPDRPPDPAPVPASPRTSYFADGGGSRRAVAIAAVGGYARREMTIHSDVDLLLPVPRARHALRRRASPSGIQLWLWDAGADGRLRDAHDRRDDRARARATRPCAPAVLDAALPRRQRRALHEFADAIRATSCCADAEQLRRASSARRSRSGTRATATRSTCCSRT